MKIKTYHMALWPVLIIMLALIPKVGPYYTNLLVTFAVFSVFSVSFNMLLGYTGILNFGHAIFFGAGSYGIALALKHIDGLSLFPALAIGVLAAVVVAAILCPLAVRLTHSFAMWHLAFNLFMVVLAYRLKEITGGEDGIGNFRIPALEIPGLNPISIQGAYDHFYYFAVIVLGICVWLMWFFTKTPFGQVQIGIRDNERRITYLGFKVSHAKAVIYIASAAFAGVAGSIYTLFNNLASPEGSLLVFYIPIVSTVVGGASNFFGPVLGTAFFQVIEEMASRYTDKIELLTGTILVIVMLFAPTGIIGLIKKGMSKMKTKMTMKGKVASTAKVD